MTCKLFKTIVDSAYLKLAIRCVDVVNRTPTFMLQTTRIVVSPWDDFTITDTQIRNGQSRCHISPLKRWNEVFKSFQLVSVRHASSTAALGRFSCNPYLQLEDFRFLNPDILQRLRPLFERTKRPPTSVERERIPFKTPLSYSRDEIVNVIIGRNKKIMTFSVRTWKATDIPQSSLSISARVKEWWIIEMRRSYGRTDIYIVGYYEKRHRCS